jgi:ceramide glucosyltransferase
MWRGCRALQNFNARFRQIVRFNSFMVHPFTAVIGGLAGAGTVASILYYCLALRSAAAFLRMREADKSVRPTQSGPPVTILKPLRGTDPKMYESFRSHCLQDYPEYEIIFGVSDANDPAIQLVDRLQKEFPRRNIQLLICRENLGTNTKVSNLAQMARAARYDCFIVNDSDIRVEPDYLRRIVAPLSNPQIGLVTCLYRGIANASMGSRLEALGISTDFAAGVLVAQLVERGITFGLGSTLAFRRRELEAIGGFEALVDYLADDYQLGNRIAALGLKIELSDVVVETFLPQYTLRGFWDHQVRWARTIRDSRFMGYVGMGVTFGLPWALLALICAGGSGWAWALLALTAVLRVAVAVAVGSFVLEDKQVISTLAWLPIRDLIALAVWIASFAGHDISWRGDKFKLQNGKLIKINGGRASSPV